MYEALSKEDGLISLADVVTGRSSNLANLRDDFIDFCFHGNQYVRDVGEAVEHRHGAGAVTVTHLYEDRVSLRRCCYYFIGLTLLFILK